MPTRAACGWDVAADGGRDGTVDGDWRTAGDGLGAAADGGGCSDVAGHCWSLDGCRFVGGGYDDDVLYCAIDAADRRYLSEWTEYKIVLINT